MTEVEADEQTDERRGGFGSLGSIGLALVLTWAAGIASFPLNDNSFFTHLATGRLILERGSVPSADPFTFTARGEPWTVQSWLVSVAYAGAERLGADLGVRVVVLALLAAAATVLWAVSRPATSFLLRLGLVAVALVVCTDLWGERPYMVGFVGLGVVWLALQGRVRPWLLVPMLWVWVNSHGSFPLAFVLIVAVAAGRALDRRPSSGGALTVQDGSWTRDRPVLVASLVGTLLGAVSPVGPRLLWFPFTAVSRSEVFADILEWQPPTYRSLAERAFLVLFAGTVLLLVRRPRWELALPAVAFGCSAVLAQRNVVMATLVLVAVAAAAMPAFGTLQSQGRPRLGTLLAALCSALAGLVALAALASPAPGLGGYPARALAWLPQSGLAMDRVAGEILAGNLLEVLDGPDGEVFIDDRVDMFPPEVFDDHLELVRGTPAWSPVLDRYDIDVVVWSRQEPLGSLLAASDEWSVRFSDADWVVACRRGSSDC